MMSRNTKPLASLSMDLDNKWSYMKTAGVEGWQDFPSYLPYAVPRILDFLDRRNLRITVFVIGKDAELAKNQQAIASLAKSGHEIANHSYMHEPWLHAYSPQELTEELDKTERLLESVTGQRPVGFRGPGFSFSDELCRQLVERGYRYDASTFPTFLGPVARAYTFLKSRLSKAQREERKELFGSWTEGFQSNQPFLWRDEQGGSLLEIPVTTMPLLKVPIHGSYVLYLAGYSHGLARTYFRVAMKLCRWLGVEPSLLLHPLDFLGCDDEPELSFFPAMNQRSEDKLKIMSDCIRMLAREFEPVTMRVHADAIRERSPKRHRKVPSRLVLEP